MCVLVLRRRRHSRVHRLKTSLPSGGMVERPSTVAVVLCICGFHKIVHVVCVIARTCTDGQQHRIASENAGVRAIVNGREYDFIANCAQWRTAANVIERERERETRGGMDARARVCNWSARTSHKHAFVSCASVCVFACAFGQLAFGCETRKVGAKSINFRADPACRRPGICAVY